MDGFTIGHIPPLGGGNGGTEAATADFTYEWEDVGFTARVWEQPRAEGGFRVVLQILVLRGDTLSDLAAVRAFLTRYHERAADWALTPFHHNGGEGLYGATEAFWTPGPGVAVEVRDPLGELGAEELLATARGVRPDPDSGPGPSPDSGPGGPGPGPG